MTKLPPQVDLEEGFTSSPDSAMTTQIKGEQKQKGSKDLSDKRLLVQTHWDSVFDM